MILVVDNYDSFVFNVVRYFEELGETVEVVRNDALDVAGIRARNPEAVVISPGPCPPAEAGVSLPAIRELSGEVPILGVCLGHQAIGAAFGGRVEVEHVFPQNRLAAFETRTDDYTMVNASASISPFGKDSKTSLLLSANNLFDVVARRHSSFLKDFAPLAGRDIRVTLRFGL